MEPTDTTHGEVASGDPATAARFIVEEPGQAPRVVLLSRGGALRIGRGEDQDVRLDDPRTSCHHAEILSREDRVLVRDAGSRNGTWLDARRVTAARPVSRGTIIRVGSTRLVYVPLEPSYTPAEGGDAAEPDATAKEAAAWASEAPLQSLVMDVERDAITTALMRHHGNQSHAARTLGISRRALIYKMERLGLKAQPRRAPRP